jgi:hypothetical protein
MANRCSHGAESPCSVTKQVKRLNRARRLQLPRLLAQQMIRVSK